MRSPDSVAEAIDLHLQDVLPGWCVAFAVDEPKTWKRHAALSVDRVPAIFTDIASRNVVGLVDHTDEGDPIYEVRWATLVTGWISTLKHEHWAEITAVRNRLEAATISAVLDDQSLADEALAVDHHTLRTELSEPWRPASGPLHAAFELSFDTKSVETLTRPVLAEPPLTVDLTAQLLEDQ